MTDWQLTVDAGAAIGLELEGVEDRDAFPWTRDEAEPWLPLDSDDQAMLLVKRLHLHIDQRPGKQISVQDPNFEILVYGDMALGERALNRAIVECAAKLAR